jgi:Trypsin-like peptidase domain
MTKVWMRRVILVAFILILGATEGNGIGLSERWERAVVFVEYKRLPGRPCLPDTQFKSPNEEKTALEYCPVGSGFLMHICGNTLLFSNRHVLSLQPQIPLVVRMKKKTGEFVRLKVGTWQSNPHPEIDIAASFIELPEGAENEVFLAFAFNEDKDRQAKEPQSNLVKLEDLRVGDEVLLVGYPSSIPNVLEILQTYDAPIFRGGIVSLKLPGVTSLKMREGQASVQKSLKDIFLIDAWSFPGNSGSPVFLQPILLQYGNDRSHINFNRPYIVGIQGVTISGTGLTIVYAADGIEETAAQFPGAQCPLPLPTKTQK